MISIVIPAHNEENYISETLNHIKNLFYPKDLFEVLVVENGSTDYTYDIANKFNQDNIKVYHLDLPGVSRAKNFGLKNISNKSEWVVFLDGDTVLRQNFLKDLSLFLTNNVDKNFVIGTTKVMPLENKKLQAILWMKFYDLGHKYTKTSYAIQIMKATLKDKVKFNESLSLAEDLEFIKDCLKYGNFFYFDTDSVLTSIRRFEKIGWFRLFLKWNYNAFLWRLNAKIKSDYSVIR